MNTRSNLGFDDDDDQKPAVTADVLDLSGFQPKAIQRPDQQKIAQAAAKAAFKSREPKTLTPQPVEPVAAVKRRTRRATGRNAQINLKARPDVIERFYKLADDHDTSYAVAFEKAVAALEKELRK